MRIFHPSGPNAIAARNQLLQRALRPEPVPFTIEREYPIVLAPSETRYSYCLGEPENPVAHANLWPRLLTGLGGAPLVKVGLVGNVATDERFRGQGIMRQLLDELQREARRQGLQALVLWSDLIEFYQKLGFTSFGQERRYRFAPRRLAASGVTSGTFVTAKELAPQDIAAMLKIRFPVDGTLQRSIEEFQTLLGIPALAPLIRRGPGGTIDAFALVGKGCDMIGVIHEWGAPTPEDLLSAVAAAGQLTGFQEILLLAPKALPEVWQEELKRHAEDESLHAVGMMLALDQAAKSIGDSFIWGLDSI